ncbi:MAG: sialidase family protein [Thermoplasmatota archaeon]
MRANLIAVALVAAMAAAGCLSAAVSPNPVGQLSSAIIPARNIAAFNAVIDADGGQGEPSMGVAPNGALFTNGGGSTQGMPVYRSPDGGRTWKEIADPIAPFPNLDPDLAVSADGVVWADALSLACTTTSVSRDGGATWSQANPASCMPPGGDRQYLVPMKPGEALLYSHSVPTAFQGVAKTTDYGATWTPAGYAHTPLQAAMGNLSTSGWGGGGFWDQKTGSVFLTFTTNDFRITDETSSAPANTWHPSAAVTRDEGASFSLITLPNAGGQSVGLSLITGAADRAGNVYLTWAEAHGKDGQDMRIYAAGSRDDGKTWTKPIRVDDTNMSKEMPVITAGDDGRVAIAYYEADEHGDPTNVSRQATWNVTLAWTSDFFGNATFDHGQLSTHILRRGGLCGGGDGCSRDRQLLDYFALKALPDGRVASVWASTEDVPGRVVNVVGVSSLNIVGEWATQSTAAKNATALPVPLSDVATDR